MASFISSILLSSGFSYGLSDLVVGNEAKSRQKINCDEIEYARTFIQNKAYKDRVIARAAREPNNVAIIRLKEIAANPHRVIIKARALNVLWTGIATLPTIGYVALSASKVVGLLGTGPVAVVVLTPVISKMVAFTINTVAPEAKFYDPVDAFVTNSYKYVKLAVIVINGTSAI